MIRVLSLLLAASLPFTIDVLAQETCEELCFTTCIIAPQEVCEKCLAECEKPRWRRVAPVAPSKQHGVDYTLHRTLGLTALSYMDEDFPGWFQTAQDIGDLGFTTAQFWIDEPPYCAGHWEPPYPSYSWVTDASGCEMEWLFAHGSLTQIFLKPSIMSWSILREDDGNRCYVIDTTPQAFLVYRLYEMAWWRDLTVVFTRWEQDFFLLGCPPNEEISEDLYMRRYEQLKWYEDREQRNFESARGAMMDRYPNAKLNVLRSMVVNKFPGYNTPEWAEDWPTVADMVGEMVEDPELHEPDLVGVSYWKRGLNPIPALDWVKETTHYPKNRMFIAEFGAAKEEQPKRYEDYIRAFWEWGIRTILVWAYEDNWEGKHEPTPDGLAALQGLNNEAIFWRSR